MSTSDTPQSMMRYAGLATQWMAMLGIAVFAGYKLDKVLSWRVPVFLIVFPVTALGLSLWQLIKVLSKPKK